ncbi:MAG: hypothetical protein ACREMV_06645 [Gemmatimonadales bacterium]
MSTDSTVGQFNAASLRQAIVLEVEGDGAVVVRAAPGDDPLLCELLETGDGKGLLLAPRDVVLVWQPDPLTPRGILLGRIGLSHAATGTPDELVLEARHSLTLRVGDGSITIREDGKILIKGKDLVSHAQRVNRIKGGAIQIN